MVTPRLLWAIGVVMTVGSIAGVLAQAPESAPAERDGLQVVVQPSKATFTPDEPLVVTVRYRNVSKEAFRLRDQVDPALYGGWVFTMEAVSTGTAYTGVSRLPSGAALDDRIRPATLSSGESRATTVTLRAISFLEGTLTYEAAKDALFQLPNAGVTKPLPPGTYKFSVEIEQERFGKATAGDNPVPLWRDHEIRSNPVEIVIAGR